MAQQFLAASQDAIIRGTGKEIVPFIGSLKGVKLKDGQELLYDRLELVMISESLFILGKEILIAMDRLKWNGNISSYGKMIIWLL